MHAESKKGGLLGQQPISVIQLLASTAAAVLVGLGVVYEPLVTTAIAGAAAGIVVAYRWRPLAVLAYFLFVIVQDLIQNFVRDLPDWHLVVKRLDEFALLILLVVTLSRHRGIAFRPVRPAFLFLGGTLVVGLVSTAFGTTEYLLAGYDIFLLYKGFIVFYIVSQLKIGERGIRKAIDYVFLAAAICLGAAILDFVLGVAYRSMINHPRAIDYRRGFPTVVSIFEHTGVAGWFFAFCACVALACWIVKRTPLHLFLTFAFSAGSLMTLRRKPIIGLAAVFILAIFLTSERRTFLRTAVAVTLLTCCVLLTAGDLIGGVFEDLISQYVDAPDPTRIARYSMHAASVQLALDYFPLGAGYGRFGGWIATLHYNPLYYEYGLSTVPGLTESRPVFLQDAFWPHVIGELGLIGFALFLLALYYLVKPVAPGIGVSHPIRAITAYAAIFVFAEALPESFGWVVFEDTLAGSFIFGFLALAWLARGQDAGEPSGSAVSPFET